MRTIRNGLFETNSSSVHTITISEYGRLTQRPRDDSYAPFQSMYFGCFERTYSDFPTKLLYLLGSLDIQRKIASTEKGEDDYLKICAWLESEGIVWDFENLDVQIEDYFDIPDFIHGLTRNLNLLGQFLYCPKSKIYTGDDGDEESKAVRIVKKWIYSPDIGLGWKYLKGRKIGSSYFIWGKGQ